jgi:hypothetical protein
MAGAAAVAALRAVAGGGGGKKGQEGAEKGAATKGAPTRVSTRTKVAVKKDL